MERTDHAVLVLEVSPGNRHHDIQGAEEKKSVHDTQGLEQQHTFDTDADLFFRCLDRFASSTSGIVTDPPINSDKCAKESRLIVAKEPRFVEIQHAVF